MAGGGECSGVRAAPAVADHQAEHSKSREHQPSYAVRPVHRRATTPSLRRDIRHYLREQEDITFHHAWAEGLRWMREDVDVEERAEQVLVAQPQHNKEVE